MPDFIYKLKAAWRLWKKTWKPVASEHFSVASLTEDRKTTNRRQTEDRQMTDKSSENNDFRSTLCLSCLPS